MNIGIVGCGAIANMIVSKFISDYDDGIKIKYFFDTDMERAENLAVLADGVAVLKLEDMLPHVDLVLEAASPKALKSIALDILGSGTDLMAMSVGALMDADFRHDVYNTAREHDVNVYAPTGAIVGIDGIKAAAKGEIFEARLTTRKSPKSLGRDVEKEEILFEGKASEAVKEFPVNINVAATLSIACHMDIDVKIIVDPKVDRNQHEVYVRGEFGEFKTCSMNLPSKANPKTSQMAAYSAIRLLESFGDNFHIGT